MSHRRNQHAVEVGLPIIWTQTLRFYVIFNRRAGTASRLGITAEVLADKLRAAGLHFELDEDDEADLPRRVERAHRSGADVLLAAGGDGTVTAIAEAAIQAGRTIALLPFGTANLLARDLEVPLDLDDAISAIHSMVLKPIDIGEVNGRVFLHKVVVGTFPAIAAAREELRDTRTAASKIKFLNDFYGHVRASRRMAIAIRPLGGTKTVRRVHAIAIANNHYEEGLGRLFSRSGINDGVLTLYLLKSATMRDLARLALKMLAGRWHHDDAIEIEESKEVILDTKMPELEVMLDGEVMRLATPLHFKIRPNALSVLAPPDADMDGGRS